MKTYQLVAVLALVGLVVGAGSYEVGVLLQPRVPAPSTPIVNPEMQQLAAPVVATGATAPRASRLKLSSAVRDFATELRGSNLKSSGQIKAAWQSYSDKTLAKLGLNGQFPGFSAAFETAFGNCFKGGTDVVADPGRAADFFLAIAQGMGG